MCEPVIAQVGPMQRPDIPDPPRFWVLRYFANGEWDRVCIDTKVQLDTWVESCGKDHQSYQVVTIPGVETDE